MFIVIDMLVLKDIDLMLVILFILKMLYFLVRIVWVFLFVVCFLYKCKKVMIVNRFCMIFIFLIFVLFGVYLKEIFVIFIGYKN